MLEESVSIQIGENNSSSTKYCTVHKSCNASMVIKLFQIVSYCFKSKLLQELKIYNTLALTINIF